MDINNYKIKEDKRVTLSFRKLKVRSPRSRTTNKTTSAPKPIGNVALTRSKKTKWSTQKWKKPKPTVSIYGNNSIRKLSTNRRRSADKPRRQMSRKSKKSLNLRRPLSKTTGAPKWTASTTKNKIIFKLFKLRSRSSIYNTMNSYKNKKK